MSTTETALQKKLVIQLLGIDPEMSVETAATTARALEREALARIGDDGTLVLVTASPRFAEVAPSLLKALRPSDGGGGDQRPLSEVFAEIDKQHPGDSDAAKVARADAKAHAAHRASLAAKPAPAPGPSPNVQAELESIRARWPGDGADAKAMRAVESERAIRRAQAGG